MDTEVFKTQTTRTRQLYENFPASRALCITLSGEREGEVKMGCEWASKTQHGFDASVRVVFIL